MTARGGRANNSIAMRIGGTDDAVGALRGTGFVLLSPDELERVIGVERKSLEDLRPFWDHLPPDPYLRDGGRYRSRRHSCYVHVPADDVLTAVPRRAHWQSLEYNKVHGGIARWYEPIEEGVTTTTVWQRVLRGAGRLFAAARPVERWHIEAHQFRIDTASGVGKPTPEGAHRDGVDYVLLLLVARRDVTGGETRVFASSEGFERSFTLREPGSAFLMDDARVMHETTPIVANGPRGYRDTLVVTFRAEGFQEEGTTASVFRPPSSA